MYEISHTVQYTNVTGHIVKNFRGPPQAYMVYQANMFSIAHEVVMWVASQWLLRTLQPKWAGTHLWLAAACSTNLETHTLGAVAVCLNCFATTSQTQRHYWATQISSCYIAQFHSSCILFHKLIDTIQHRTISVAYNWLKMTHARLGLHQQCLDYILQDSLIVVCCSNFLPTIYLPLPWTNQLWGVDCATGKSNIIINHCNYFPWPSCWAWEANHSLWSATLTETCFRATITSLLVISNQKESWNIFFQKLPNHINCTDMHMSWCACLFIHTINQWLYQKPRYLT